MQTHMVTGASKVERRGLLVALAQADAAEQPLTLDLTPLDAGDTSKRRISPTWWLPALSNLLIGTYGHLDLRVRLPTDPSLRTHLVRTGVLFALVQRPAATRFLDDDEAVNRLVTLSKRNWTPKAGEALFPEVSGARAAERLYVYSNTQNQASAGYFKRYEDSAAFPWLGDAIPRPADRVERSLWASFITATSVTFGEILDNASTHAFKLRDRTFHAGWLGTDIAQASRSCLIVSVTKGGKGSHDRLHFLSVDNGFSLSRTMRWQHPLELRHDDGAELVQQILSRRLAERDIAGHNGAGLWHLWHMVKAAGGSVTVLTEDDVAERSAIRVELKVSRIGDQPDVKLMRERIPIRGTVIHTQLEIPRMRGLSAHEIAARLEQFQNHTAELGGAS